MSTTAVTPEVTPTVPEVTIQNTPAEILASHTAEKEAQAASTATPEAVPTTPAPPVESKPYAITKNEDGSVKLDFITEKGVKETFTGTYEEVLDKVAASKASGDAMIKTLTPTATPIAPAPVVTTPTTWVPDESTSLTALNGMLTGGNFGDAVGIGLAQMFGANDPKQVRQAIGDLIQLGAELRGQRAVSEFAQKAPDFPWSEANTTLLLQELQTRGLQATTDNLVFTHDALKGRSAYKAVTAQPVVQGTPNPAPPNGVNPPQGNADPNREWKIPLSQLEAEIRAGK